MRDRFKFVVAGHARCGTHYMAKLLQAFGYDVGEEAFRPAGVSAWQWAICGGGVPWIDRDRRRIDKIEHFIHVIRNPDCALWSIAYGYDDPDHVRIKHEYGIQIPEWSLLDNAALSYLTWNRIILAQGPDVTIQVENAPELVSRYLGEPVPESGLPPTDFNSRPKMKRPGYYGEPVRRHLRSETRELIERWSDRWGYELRESEAAA